MPKNSHEDSEIEKYYSCGKDIIALKGQWADPGKFRQELGGFSWEKDFGKIPEKTSATYTACNRNGSQSNDKGYLSEVIHFNCKEGMVNLRGQWGSEYQGNWEYHTSLGEVEIDPRYVKDPEKDMEFLSESIKYCHTKHGFKVCGSIDTPRIDHGEPPPYLRD